MDLLSQSFAFPFTFIIVARVAAMVARNACHLLPVTAHAACCANSLPMPVATCSGVQPHVPLESQMGCLAASG